MYYCNQNTLLTIKRSMKTNSANSNRLEYIHSDTDNDNVLLFFKNLVLNSSLYSYV